jgi:hypothetical protein
MKIEIVGMDPSLNNWGIVVASMDTQTLEVEILSMGITETEPGGAKTVRKNSDDIARARLLTQGMVDACEGATVAFCEVPVGSQSARAMASYGICVGVLGGCPVPLIELTPYEVKLAAVNCKTAAKEEMIEWAVHKHPNAPWPRRGGKVLAKAEHLADALASIYAGFRTEQFLVTLRMLRAASGVAA